MLTKFSNLKLLLKQQRMYLRSKVKKRFEVNLGDQRVSSEEKNHLQYRL